MKTVIASTLKLPTLYHLSFRSDLAGNWKPRLPAGSETVGNGPFMEPMVPRVSLAPTIEGCFAGIYPNISKLFEEKNYPHMYFSVYSPVILGTERVWTPEAMVKNRLVWDAFFTQEYAILDPVEMKLVGEVKVLNTNKLPTKMIHPFNDSAIPEKSVGPDGIKFTWTKRL